MARTKPPVLTSPWKIGFFVSLMLVLVGIGVGFWFTRQFELRIGWNNLNAWRDVAQGRGVLFELLPAAALVFGASLLSFLLITQAVRKYKRYLDSGQDYKNLVASLRQIDDINDEDQIEQLRDHPELRIFLLKAREALNGKDHEIREREKALENSVMTAKQAAKERFAAECRSLVDAVRKAGDGAAGEGVALSIPELQELEELIWKHRSGGEAAAKTEAESRRVIQQLEAVNETLETTLQEMGAAAAKSLEEKAEIESLVSELAAGSGSSPARWVSPDDELRNLLTSFDALEQLSTSLATLGETARGNAISAATQAGSGNGSQADIVKFAEELKNVAGRFNELSKSYMNLVAGMKNSMNKLETRFTEAAEAVQNSGDPSRSVEEILSKMSLWSADLASVAKRVKSAAHAPSVDSVVDAPQQADSVPPDSETPSDESAFGFEKLGGNPPEPSRAGDEDDLRVLHEKAEGKLFAELSTDGDDISDTMDFQEVELTDSAHSAGRDEKAGPGRDKELSTWTDDDQQEARTTRSHTFDTGAIDLDAPGAFARSNESVATEEATRTAEHAEDDEIVDLYSLGAVDYDPALHM